MPPPPPSSSPVAMARAEDVVVTLTRLPARDAEDAYALADADALSDASAGPSSSPPRGVGTAAADDRTTLAILVPFREDGTGRAAQLERLLSRLASLFAARLSQVVVLVAEQAPDGRKFNRGQLLNAAFAHLARRGAEMVFPGTPPGERLSLHPARTLYCFHDCDMLPHRTAAPHYLRAPPRGVTPFVRVLNAGGCRYDPAGVQDGDIELSEMFNRAFDQPFNVCLACGVACDECCIVSGVHFFECSCTFLL